MKTSNCIVFTNTQKEAVLFPELFFSLYVDQWNGFLFHHAFFLHFSYIFLRSTSFPGSLSGQKGKSLGTCSRDHRTQCNDTVFVTYLSLFSVASFSGEAVRGDDAADIANETVGLHRILPYRLRIFEVVLLPKCLVIYWRIFSVLNANKPCKTFCFLKILTTRTKTL